MKNPYILLSVALASSAFGQELAPPEEQPVSGSCVVSLGTNVYKREKCELSTEDGKVPNGFLLVVQHVSAACSTSSSRGVYTLALITRLSPDGASRTTHVPLNVQAITPDQVRLVGAQNVTIHAGSVTSIESLLSTWEGAPAGHTACDLTFSGVLKRVSQ